MKPKQLTTLKAQFLGMLSLDHLRFNIRWLKEWKRFEVEDSYERREPYTIFWIVLAGGTVVEIDRVQYELSRGDLVCLPARTFYRWIKFNPPFHHLSFACEAKVGAFDLVKMYQFPYVFHLDDQATFNQLVNKWRTLSISFSRTIQNMEHSDNTKWISKPTGIDPSMNILDSRQTIDYLEALFHGLGWLRLVFNTLLPKLPDQPITYDSRIFQVSEYIRRNLDQRPSLEELANLVDLSKEHLRTLFNKELHTSPMKYVVQLRMERACEMLLLQSSKIKHIAEALGYEDQRHFTRAFQQAEGLSPTQYRMKHKQY